MSFLELADTFIPCFDNLTNSYSEFNWLTSGMTWVKNSTIWQFTGVVYLHLGSSRYYWTTTFVQFFNLQSTLKLLHFRFLGLCLCSICLDSFCFWQTYGPFEELRYFGVVFWDSTKLVDQISFVNHESLWNVLDL